MLKYSKSINIHASFCIMSYILAEKFLVWPRNPSKINPDIWSDHEKWIGNSMIKHYITVWRVQCSGCLWGERNFETLKPGLLKTFLKNNTQLRQTKDKMRFNSTNSPKAARSNFDYYVITTLEKPKIWK